MPGADAFERQVQIAHSVVRPSLPASIYFSVRLPQPPSSINCRFIMQGPRDRLSTQQIAWMNALDAAGLHAEVLKVVEPETAAAGGGRKRRL